MRAQRADLERLDRELQVVNGAGGRREMKYVVHAAGQINVLRHVVMDELEVRVAGQVGDVVGIARKQIVDGDDAMAFGQKAVRKMRAEKARATGDDRDRGEEVGVMTLSDSQNSCRRATKKRGQATYFAPKPVRTTGTVRARILRSSQSDQLSMYWRSSFIHWSKPMWLRPLICQMQVRPGFIERRRRCQGSYCWTSLGMGGRGPTRLMSPTEDIPELRQFVDAGLAQEPAERRDARVVLHLEDRAAHFVEGFEFGLQHFGVVDHRAELVHGEESSVQTAAFLPEQNRARAK